jgi:replicative DNA helicase
MSKVPHDIEAERSLLGAVLLRPAVYHAQSIEPEEFFHPGHRLVWAAMGRVLGKGAPLDAVSVGDDLATAGKLDAAGGYAALSAMSLATPTADNASYYAGIVRELASRRRLLVDLSETMAAIQHGEQREQLQSRVHSASASYVGAGAPRYASVADRLPGESIERLAMGTRAQKYHVNFLDDYLRGIAPRDLVVIGARTGAGKTELVRLIAQQTAAQGKRVYLLALEAEPREIERRIKYAVLAHAVHKLRIPGGEELNYPDWLYGRCHGITGSIEKQTDEWIAQHLRTLHTLYRGVDFGMEDLEQRLRELEGRADLVILDHLHYVDIDDRDENRGVKAIVKTIRNAALITGVPVIVVAHLRKRDRGRKMLVPEIDDFHGTSDITKIATSVIMLGPAHDQPSTRSWVANTYFSIPKMRAGGACPYVAMVGYDRLRHTYEPSYMLGKLSFAGDSIEFISKEDYPRWAVHGGNGA